MSDTWGKLQRSIITDRRQSQTHLAKRTAKSVHSSKIHSYVRVDVSAVPVQLTNVRLANCSFDGASPLCVSRWRHSGAVSGYYILHVRTCVQIYDKTYGCPRFVWYSWMGVVTWSSLTLRTTTPDTRPGIDQSYQESDGHTSTAFTQIRSATYRHQLLHQSAGIQCECLSTT